MALTVGEAAQLSRVSVRTLHHYDEIGLLNPSARSDAGYRLYDDDDLRQLQQILLFRELGFSLDDIRRIVLDPSFDRAEALRPLVPSGMTMPEAVLVSCSRRLTITRSCASTRRSMLHRKG